MKTTTRPDEKERNFTVKYFLIGEYSEYIEENHFTVTVNDIFIVERDFIGTNTKSQNFVFCWHSQP